MLRQKNETYDEFERRMSTRADILFPSMKDKNKVKKSKNLPLGKSIFDDDDDDENELLSMNKVKSPLDVLTDDKYNKQSADKKDEKTAEKKSRKDRTPEEEEEMLDEFYPSMKNTGRNKTEESGKTDTTGMKVPETADKNNSNSFKKEADNRSLPEKIKEYFNNMKEKHNKDKIPLLKASIEKSDLKLSDQNFVKSMDVIFENEGGFSNHKNDKGGRTNMGITQKTYDDYCRRHGLEKKDVKNLTKEEAAEVYYNDYWKASGADKIDNKADALILFDTAILHGVGKAKQFYKQSNGNSDKMLELRKEHYLKKVQSDSTQNDFLKGWNNRVNKLDKILKESRK